MDTFEFCLLRMNGLGGALKGGTAFWTVWTVSMLMRESALDKREWTGVRPVPVSGVGVGVGSGVAVVAAVAVLSLQRAP